jgi:hypothetical protein
MRGGRIAVVAAAAACAAVAPAVADTGVGVVGPGPVRTVIAQHGHRLVLRMAPNRSTSSNVITVTVTRGGKPVAGARVTMTLWMDRMAMGPDSYPLVETAPGTYLFSGRAMMMGGDWRGRMQVAPRGGRKLAFTFVDELRA